MKFTSRELRNKDRALLRRIERRLQKQEEEQPEECFSEDLFKIEAVSPISLFEQPVRKQTRLGLYKNRSGGRR